MKLIRLMGDGFEPHILKEGEQVIYAIYVQCGFMERSFAFNICYTDLAILLSDDYRSAILEVVAHTLLQSSMVIGGKPFTQHDFDNLIRDTLYSSFKDLQTFIAQVGREHHIAIEYYVKKIMDRRFAKAV